ncbi:MAG: energy-coupling factor transporter ATPase [Negativibacillus sp.]
MNDFIEARGISFSYAMEDDPNPIRVFENLDFTIGQGELVAILGHNGSGKSTLAKHFNAILLPDEGQLTVDGMDTQDNDKLYDIRQEVGMVFQNPDNQIVATVVEEDVAFGLENMGVEPSEIRRRVDQALESVGISEYKTHAPHRLSGGQKQRVAIAGIIAMRPRCIVLDEPTAMLDPQGRGEVMRTILDLNRNYGITIVLITHYMDEAAQCDRVVVMDSGAVLLDSTPKEVFSHVKMLKSVGLDVPQATEICYELNKAGYTMPTEVLSVRDCADELQKLIERTYAAKRKAAKLGGKK